MKKRKLKRLIAKIVYSTVAKFHIKEVKRIMKEVSDMTDNVMAQAPVLDKPNQAQASIGFQR